MQNMNLNYLTFLLICILSSTSFSQHEKSERAYQLLERCFNLTYSNPDSVLIYSIDIISSGQQLHDPILEAGGYAELGNAVRTKGQAEKSLIYYFKAISILGDSDKEKSKKASVYSAIGNAYYMMGDFNQATFNYQKSYHLKTEVEEWLSSAMVASQLVGIYAVQSKIDSAFVYARLAEPILVSEGKDGYRANLYNSIGAAHQMNGNLDSALFYFLKAELFFKKSELELQLISTYFNIGNVLYELGQYQKAISYFKISLPLLEKFPNVNQEFLCFEGMTKSAEAMNNFEAAFEYKKIQDSLQLVINKEKEQSAIQKMEEKFLLAEQEKILSQQQIEIQQKDLDLAKANEKFYRILTFGILFIGATLIFLLWFWFKKKSQDAIQKEKEKFFANIMHEIRTPLALITGPAENLKGELSDSDREKNMELITRNSKRLTNLVNQLLDSAKIDSGKFVLTKQSGNLSVFLREIIEDFEMAAMQKSIRINFQEIDTNRIVRSDFDALQKIISNLISNAIKYSPHKTEINIVACCNDNNFILKVTDQGVGISKADQTEIFERFSRGKNSGMSGGVGIGLSLVKQLLDLLQGKIFLESSVGKGSTFEVHIPVEFSDIKVDLRSLEQDAKIVLLVEDDADMRTFIQDVLMKENLHVIVAENGIKALEVLNDTMPDIILSDVMMPEMDGITLIEKVRSNPLFEHLPFILLSAKHAAETKISGLTKGADLYLEKPFNPSELILTVKNLMTTLEKSKEKFDTQLKQELSFEERIHSDDAYIQKLNAEIIKEMDNADFSVEELADRLAISRSQLHRKIKSLTGKSISQYVRIIRLEKAHDLLKQNAGNVTEVAYSTGFSSQSYFTKCFTEHFGKSPSEI